MKIGKDNERVHIFSYYHCASGNIFTLVPYVILLCDRHWDLLEENYFRDNKWDPAVQISAISNLCAQYCHSYWSICPG